MQCTLDSSEIVKLQRRYTGFKHKVTVNYAKQVVAFWKQGRLETEVTTYRFD